MAPEDFPQEWIDRFWSKVDRTGDCWLWIAAKTLNGYGHIGTKSLSSLSNDDYAHRLVWMFTTGPIPDGMVICHRCDIKLCVNPDHLFLGTQAENLRDMVQKRRSLFGERQPNSKLTESDVIEIRALRKTGMTLEQIGDQFGVCKSHIFGILAGKTWGHVPENEAA